MTSSRIARVIHVDGKDAVVVIKDREYKISCESHPLKPGDVFLVSATDPVMLKEHIGSAIDGAWNSQSDAMRWRTPDAQGQTRMDVLWKRHAIRRATRDYLDGEGFIEIDTPLLVHGATPDATIQSFKIGDRYLVSSTEYQIKRLEVGGFDRIYTLTQNYRRDDGEGPLRNQEFTMLEWARVGQSLGDIERDAEQIVLQSHKVLGGDGKITYGNYTIDFAAPWERLSVAEALARYAGAPLPDFSLPSLRKAVTAAGIPMQDSYKDDVYFLFSLLMDHIQPSLGTSRPVFICDWPAFETSSAQEKSNNDIAERSELFIAGVEISDGFPSLTSYERQKQTFEHQQKRRRDAGVPVVDIDQSYMEAMKVGLPKGAGMALGFDRMVMVLTGQANIKSVLPFAWDEV